MKKWWQDTNGDASGKRIIGSIIVAYVIIVVSVFIVRGLDIPDNIADLLQAMFYTGGIMLTGGVVEKFSKR